MDEGKLFADVKFFIAECDKPDEVRNLLINEGARHINYLTDDVTHVIADRKCPDAEEAGELFDKPVVKSVWVHYCLQTRRLWPTDIFTPFKTIFSDVVASFSQEISKDDLKLLQLLIISNGGRLTGNSALSTHFIATSGKPTDFQDKPSSDFKIVDPFWILDSVRQKSCCDETLYDPSLLLSPPPPPPPKQATPSPQPQPTNHPLSEQQSQPQMIESNEQKSSLSSDNSNRSQQPGRPVVNQTHNEPTRKNDFQSSIRTQTLPQQSQVNAMQQTQMTRVPVMTPNVIRGASPRFRPQVNPRQTQRPMMTDQQPRRTPPTDYNQSYPKVGAYPYQPDMHQVQPQQLQQPHPQSQSQQYPHIEHAQNHPHNTAMNQPMRMAQSNMYHQVRSSYQNSHNPSCMPVAHVNTMSPQQMHQQPIQRFQDPNNQMQQPRPFPMSNPQHQAINQNYQQMGLQRQPIYYNQGPNNQSMRVQQPGPMVRSAPLSNDQMLGNDQSHHRFANQMQTQPPVYPQQQRNHLPQQPPVIQRNSPQKSQPFQQPHPPPVISNQSQLQPTIPNSPMLRAPRGTINNSPDIRMPNSRQTNTPSQVEKVPRATKNVAPQQPHPSIFDIKQESSYAQMKAKVPILTEGVNYYNFAPEHIVPQDKPLFGCKFKLIEYDDLSPKVKQNCCDVISKAGGTFEENLDNLTHLICESRSSPIFALAIKKKIRCVTLNWVNDVLSKGRLEYPWKALHVPPCFKKEDNYLKDQIISTTNLKKYDRREVEDMIRMTGAKYTDYLSRKNTLLICGSPQGEKFERAIEWGIPIANCLLISDYLIGGRKFDQMLDHAKYKNFTRGDQLKLDSYDLIKELMDPWTTPIPAAPEEPALNGVTDESHAEEVSDKLIDSNSVSGAIANEAQPETVTMSVEVDQVVENKAEERSEADLIIPTVDPSQLDESKVESSIVIESSYISINNESTGQQETSLETTKTEDSDDNPKKDSESNQNPLEEAQVMLVRTSDSPVRVLFTRLKPEHQKNLEKYALGLGFSVVSFPSDCTHLIVDQISRSPKFICAFNHANFILSYKWLEDSHKYGKPLDETAYILQDKEGEERCSFNLVHSLMKKKKRNHLLFKDFVFFVTPSVVKNVSKITEMITSAGAVLSTKKLPTRDQISMLKSGGKRFVVLADQEDLYLLDSIALYGVDVMDKEFVLSGILRQDLDFDSHRLSNLLVNGHRKELNISVQPSPPKKIRHI